MKSKCISIHSSRGGTGKSLLATNLAMIYAKKGVNVALLDLDFRAPSLEGVFSKIIKNPVECWLNDYLNGRCSAEDATVDISGNYDLKGKLLVGLANPNLNVMRNMAERSRAWEVSAIKRLFSLRSYLFEKMKIDRVFLDTSPGVQYMSVNAAVSSDLSLVVTTLDSIDLMGTKNVLTELYDAFEKKTAIVINKVFPQVLIQDNAWTQDIIERVEKILGRSILGTIPCYCDVLQTDRSTVLAIEKPNHPFIKDLEAIVKRLEQEI
jgi:MinD-like ATPase involved in chromosome partitioning or flagellar assembly